MSIQHIVTFNGSEITEHNRKLVIAEQLSVSDIELSNGNLRRFYHNNKKTFTLNWSYLPSLENKTVDSRKGQTFLSNLANTSSNVLITIQTEPGGEYKPLYCFIDSYEEKLLRRDYTTQCAYYDVSMTLTER